MSSPPPPYARQANFTTFSTNHPDEQQPGIDLDNEFNALLTTINATIARLAQIQRADGPLLNAIVTPDSLSTTTLALLAAAGIQARGGWLTTATYAAKDLVSQTSIIYICLVPHTAGVFATDLAAGKWMVFSNSTNQVTWDRPVIGINTGSPGGPTIGDRYLVDPAGGTGLWAGIAGQIAEWRAPGQWEFSPPPKLNQTLDAGPVQIRYSQEAYDVGAQWRPVYLSAGGTLLAPSAARGYLQPTDEPAALASISIDGRATCFGIFGFGSASAVQHFHKIRLTGGAPSIMKSGDFFGSTGYRHWDPTSGVCAGSSVAVEVTSTEDAVPGNFYCGSKHQIETTAPGGSPGLGNTRRACNATLDNGGFVAFGTAGLGLGANMSAGGSNRFFFGPESLAGAGIQSDGNPALYLNRNTSTGTLMDIRQANNTVGSIGVTGGATTFNTTSDERLKNFDVPQRDFGAMIDAIEIKDAVFHAEPGNTVLSVSAQQVASTGFTDAITYPEAQMVNVLDENGNKKYTDPVPVFKPDGTPDEFAEHVEVKGVVGPDGKPVLRKMMVQRMSRQELMRLETDEEAQQRFWHAEYGRFGLLALKGVQQDRKRIAELEAQIKALTEAKAA